MNVSVMSAGERQEAASWMESHKGDTGFRRPFRYDGSIPGCKLPAGTPCVIVNQRSLLGDRAPNGGVKEVDVPGGGRKVVHAKQIVPYAEMPRYGHYPFILNAATLLPLRAVVQMENTVQRAYRFPLRAYADLRAANTVPGFDAYSKLTYSWAMISDAGEAVIDLDAVDARRDRGKLQYDSIPLPLLQADFGFTSREQAVNDSNGTTGTLRSELTEQSGRRIGELVEQLTIGVQTWAPFLPDGNQNPFYSANAGAIYGFTTWPYRVTATNLIAPDGTNGPAVLAQWLTYREQLRAQKVRVPLTVYVTPAWDRYLDLPFSTTGGNQPGATLRSQLTQAENIAAIRSLDFWVSTSYPFQLAMVPLGQANMVAALNAQEPTLVQWENRGGLDLNFKVWAMQYPVFKHDIAGSSGVLHARTA